MKATRLTYRYAKSLISLVVDKDLLDSTLSDMRLIISVCNDSREFSKLLQSPVIKTDKKLSILSEIFLGKVSETTMTFINIITSKKREIFLEGIAESFITLYKDYKNIETVTLTTASTIDLVTKNKILNYIKNRGKSEVDLTEHIDEDILGGVIIRMGDQQLDSSVSKHLKELKNSFNKNLYLKDF